MEKQNYSGDDAQVDVRQQPVAQRARAPPVDRFARRISHHAGDAYQPDQSGYPAHSQPGAAKVLSKPKLVNSPADQGRNDQRPKHSAEMPKPARGIALMNIAADGVRLISKD